MYVVNGLLKSMFGPILPPLYASHVSQLAGLTGENLRTILNATNLSGQTFWVKWVRGNCQQLLAYHYESRQCKKDMSSCKIDLIKIRNQLRMSCQRKGFNEDIKSVLWIQTKLGFCQT